MLCSICYEETIDDNTDNNCRVCNNKTCSSCFTRILMMDDNFIFCIIKHLPIIYICCYCKSNNRLKAFNDDIKERSIKILEDRLNVIKINNI